MLEITQVANADAIAAGAALQMGEGAEGLPVVVIQGLPNHVPVRDCKALIRPLSEDLFK
ncbi:Coenzyme F420:L-glutamate ligase [compost metagenome]